LPTALFAYNILPTALIAYKHYCAHVIIKNTNIPHTAQNIAATLQQYCNVLAMLLECCNIAAIFCAVWDVCTQDIIIAHIHIAHIK